MLGASTIGDSLPTNLVVAVAIYDNRGVRGATAGHHRPHQRDTKRPGGVTAPAGPEHKGRAIVQTQNSTATAVRYVRSDRNPTQFYLVALNPRGFWECECPAARFRRGVPCKHTRAVAKDGAGLVATRKDPTPGPSPARGEGASSPFTTPDDSVARGGRGWRS